MNKNYIYIIIFFWCSVLSANTSFVSKTAVLNYTETFSAISKDSLLAARSHSTDPIKKDSTKTKVVAKDPLMARWQKEKRSPLAPKGGISIDAAIENVDGKNFKSFPELDSYTENLDNVITDILSEFTQAYLNELLAVAKAKLDNNTKQVIEVGENVFSILEENQNFIDIIGGNEIIELPVGIKKNVTDNSDITLGIVRMEYHPTYTEVDMFAKLNLAELGVQDLLFAANNVKISKDGGIYGEARLTLLQDAYISLSGGQWLLVLKGGKDETTGRGNGPSYVDIDCEGRVKKLGLSADVRIAKSVAVPINDDGSVMFPEKVTPGTGESPVGNESYLGTSFAFETDDYEGLLLELDLPMFELKALPNWGFKMEKTVLDLSDIRNSAGIIFPDIYRERGLLQGNDNLWRGFHSNEVRVLLPPEFKKKGSAERIAIGARNLFIDNFGVSGDFYATNVYDLNEGDANKWQMSLDSIGVDLKVNRFVKAGFYGEIVLPISDQDSPGGKLAYNGLITADQFYSVNIEALEDVSFDIFKARAKIYDGSYINLEVENNKFYPEANLSGEMAFTTEQVNQMEGTTSEESVELEFEGLSFENLKIQSRQRPYLSVTRAGFKDNITLPKLAGFELGFHDVEIMVDENDNATIGLNCFVNLDDSGIAGDVGIEINGALEESELLKWSYIGINVTDIEIDVKRKSFEFYGSLTIFKNNPIYGKGFAGEVQLFIEDLEIEVGARGLFGAVDDYRYWFVDGYGTPSINNNQSLTIFDIGGGVYHHMRKAGMNEQATSLSGINYQPDKDTELGFKALGAFEIKRGKTFTALAGIEMSFNSKSAGGGVSRVGFYGAAILMPGTSNEGNPRYPFGTIDDMQQTVATKEESLSNFHELSIDREGILYFMDNVFPTLLTGDELFACQVGLDLDFDNKSYFASLDAYINAKGGIAASGSITFYTSPTDWYIWVGHTNLARRWKFEQIPIGPVEATIEAYFLTGTELPAAPQPPEDIAKLLRLQGDEFDFGRNFNSELAQGAGFAFGASFKIGQEFDWGIVYADVYAKAGFDLMVRDFGDAHCFGSEGPLGMDGWYATGQMYAALQGEIGARVKLFGIDKRIPILAAGIGVLAQAQLPNPWFIKGYAGIEVKVLGFINIHSRLKVIIGEECEIIGKSGLQDLVMISDITPRDGFTDVDVFDAIQVAFNAPVDSEIPFEDDQGKKTYRIGLNEFTAKNEGMEISGDYEYNNAKDVLIFSSDEILPPETEIKVMVKVSFDEKIGNNWVPVTADGLPVIEEKEVTFTTGDAPRKIPHSNIEHMYPIVDQEYMLSKESNVGYVQLDSGQEYLFGNGFSDELYFIDESGGKIKTDFSYNKAEKKLTFNIPELDNEKKYTYALITLNPGDIEEDQVLSAVEFNEVAEDLEISNNTLIGNSNNGAFISRLDFTFKTSKYDTFLQKMSSIKILASITDLENYPDTYNSIANVGKISLLTQENEPFGPNDVIGTKFTNNIPLMQPTAIMNDGYYRDSIQPLIYREYPLGATYLNESITLKNRNGEILGVPPVRAVQISNTYRYNVIQNPDSPVLKNRFPFRWRLPIYYYNDYKDLEAQIWQRFYVNGEKQNGFNNYNYIINGRFPFLRRESYEVNFKYVIPNKTDCNSYIINYENTF